jgi:tRNA nucleotidyltransferase (CCA-adding enzyme)
MRTYVVGGAVRDDLLGLPVKDRDHVVVGATPDDMLARGFRPVGKDFPVFLHPETNEEYALARTERKTAPGYKGFAFHAAPDVTLEQDLARRDLTVNAIARDEDGTLVDPYGGRADLAARVFRHVSPAFAEDPVRILRLARFAARFPDFTVAPETMALMRAMVAAGEVDALVAERVWQELARGLMECKPQAMFAVLAESGALAHVAPELATLWQGMAMPADVGAALSRCAAEDATLAQRYAVLGAYAGHAAPLPLLDGLAKRLRVPKDCIDLALLAARERAALHTVQPGEAEALVALLERCDALRKPARFQELLEVFELPDHFLLALQAAQGVDAGAIAGRTVREFPGQPMKIAEAVHAARVESVAAGGPTPPFM